MRYLTKTSDLNAFCEKAKEYSYVTIDTEFLRERTYYAKLCLIQMALPTNDPDDVVLVDVLANGINIDAIYDLFACENVVKVFHAARQDLEIFYQMGGALPKPFFDTQIAAMVCGYGDQVGYEPLVRSLVGEQVDKSSRFTDWSQRPLSDAQKTYAAADVTHLRVVYEKLMDKINATNRQAWVDEETLKLLDPSIYTIQPYEAWQRVKTRNNSPKFLAVVKTLAQYREEEAQRRNIPKNRIFKDDCLCEIAAVKPKNMKEIGKLRLLQSGSKSGSVAEAIIGAVNKGISMPEEERPKVKNRNDNKSKPEGVVELLKVLLKARSEQEKVAIKLIASSQDLDDIALGRDVPALHGWRAELFGNQALRLMRGELALSTNGNGVEIFERN